MMAATDVKIRNDGGILEVIIDLGNANVAEGFKESISAEMKRAAHNFHRKYKGDEQNVDYQMIKIILPGCGVKTAKRLTPGSKEWVSV